MGAGVGIAADLTARIDRGKALNRQFSPLTQIRVAGRLAASGTGADRNFLATLKGNRLNARPKPTGF
jgi:hypothetical protein